MNTNPCHTTHPTAQHGVALVVALVLLVVVTLVGLAAIRGTTLQQKMTSNFYDREISFQAAEAALRAGEAWATANPTNTTNLRNCTNQQCIADPFDSGGANAAQIQSVATSTFDAGTLGTGQPQFVVEFLGACSSTSSGNFQFTNDQNNQGGGNSLTSSGVCYRVTARANPAAANDRSQVILQSIVRS